VNKVSGSKSERNIQIESGESGFETKSEQTKKLKRRALLRENQKFSER
jgi:hypothetical protein